MLFQRGPEFNSKHPHGGLKASIKRSDAFYWHADRALLHLKEYINKYILKIRKDVSQERFYS